jgi:hypothetical protein
MDSSEEKWNYKYKIVRGGGVLNFLWYVRHVSSDTLASQPFYYEEEAIEWAKEQYDLFVMREFEKSFLTDDRNN